MVAGTGGGRKRGVVVAVFSREESPINGKASVGKQDRSSATTTVQVLVTSRRVLRFRARLSKSRASAAEGVELTAGCVSAFLPYPGRFETMTRAKRWQLCLLDRAGTR